jgi:hypothetical protein
MRISKHSAPDGICWTFGLKALRVSVAWNAAGVQGGNVDPPTYCPHVDLRRKIRP